MDDDFAKSIGATPVEEDHSDFAKSIGATPTVDKESDFSRSLRYAFPGAPMEEGNPKHEIMSKIENAARATVHAAAQVPAGLIDTITAPVRDLAGQKDLNMSNLVENLWEKTGLGNPEEAAYNRNIGNALSHIDPWMSMPIAHPTTPGLGDFVRSRKTLNPELPTEKPTVDHNETAKDLGATEVSPDDVYWKNRAAQQEYEAKQNELPPQTIHVNDIGTAADPATMDALTRSTEGITYEELPPDASIPGNDPRRGITVPQDVNPRWVTDENGVPVRQGLPQEPTDLSVQNVANNTPEVNDLGNAIQEANGPKTGPDETYGAGPLNPQTGSPVLDNAVSQVNLFRGKRGQAGGIDPEVITRFINGASDLIKRSTDAFEKYAKTPIARVVGMLPEEHMSKVSGQDMVFKPAPGQDFADKAIAQGPMKTNLWKNVQSGLSLASEKTGSIALKGVAQWLNWSDKRTVLDNKKFVDPLQKTLRQLPEPDFQSLHQHMLEEQLTRTAGDLSKLSDKAQAAYKAIRAAYDQAWQRNAATRQKLGMPPVTKEEFYHASLRHGDWKQSFFDSKGRLVYHVASESKLAALKAEDWIRKHVKDIDWDKSKVFFGPDSQAANIPRDIMSTYQNMMRFFDENDPTTTLISDAINKYNEELGLKSKGFNQRFMEKNNVPGFEGNKPWLSDKQNARAFMDAQMSYLKNSNHWNNFQEALSELKPIMESPELIKNQPNIMANAAAHLSRELGINGNVLSNIESKWAKYFPKVGLVNGKPTVALGTSRGNVGRGVADVKTGTYLTLLGANIPYMITTPLQAIMSVAQHRFLSSQGYTHSAIRTTINTLQDASGGLAKHLMSSMAGHDVPMPTMSEVGKRMLKYAEDNGIIDKTVMDETGGTRNHAILDPLKKTVGATITAPEKVARWSTFVSFAHHLLDSGLPEAEAFRKAEDFTNHSLTSMRRMDRPLIVDKLGSAGQLGYVFKSYLFNYYNQLSQLASHGNRTRDYTPLFALLGTTFLLGGALSLPGVGEMDGAYNLWKNMMSFAAGKKLGPETYDPMLPMGVKGTILRDLPTLASIGTVSSLTGTNIGSRFSNQLTNVENPASDIAVPIQEAKELMSISDWAFDPTMTNALQAAHANAGATVKGMMETNLDAYKNINKSTANGRNPDNTQSYRRASDINDISTDYKRTPEDEAKRQLGFYSDEEWKTKQLRYINNQEKARTQDAYNNMMKLAVKAGVAGDQERAQQFAQKAMKLIPDSDLFNKTLEEYNTKLGLTPEERDKVKAANMLNLQKVQRLNANH